MTASLLFESLSEDETPICALSSGRNEAAVSIIRISGNKCHELKSTLFDLKSDSLKYWKLHRCNIVDRQPDDVQIVDDILVAFFKGPKSFTGQDSIEIYCHGGPYIISRILTLLNKNGVRLALPGEFTKRGFLNGKFDLTEAEGIKELIHAASHHQWLAASKLASGSLKDSIDKLRTELIGAMAYLEARIDFPDEKETDDVTLDEVYSRVLEVQKRLLRLKDSYESGRVAKDGLKVVILGAPNQGKSTLLNYLIQKNRAIVSETPGTTRDYIEESCLIRGRMIRIFDTAGIRTTDDDIERTGVELSKDLYHQADLVLLLHATDTSEEQIHEMDRLISQWPDKNIVKIRTKSDLGKPSWPCDDFISLSCKTKEGIDGLYSKIASIVDDTVADIYQSEFICNERHKLSVDNALEGIEKFLVGHEDGLFDECLAFELLQVARSLEAIVGVTDNEDILDKVFGDFCIGK